MGRHGDEVGVVLRRPFRDGAAEVLARNDDALDLRGVRQRVADLLELLERDENTLFEIMEALERIKSGAFGRCESCEKWIRKERLKAVPHARNCIDCQREMENNVL